MGNSIYTILAFQRARKKCDDVKKIQGELQTLVDDVQAYKESDNEGLLRDRITKVEDLNVAKRRRDADLRK